MARKKKHKHHHEEHVDESWLIPYADMLTLLLALFIVLFAMSSVDAQKFKQMAISLNKEFAGGTGSEEFLSKIDPASEEVQEKESESLPNIEELNKEAKEKQEELQKLKEIKEKIDKYIKEKKLQSTLKTRLTDRGLAIIIMDNALFDSGKANVKEKSIAIAQEISKILEFDIPREIVVAGHTDNRPIRSFEYDSNWDLSTARAVNFMEILLQNKKLDPPLFSAVGYGEFQPISENTNEEGRQRNRRVEVLIIPTYETKKEEVEVKEETKKETKKEVKKEVKKEKETKSSGH